MLRRFHKPLIACFIVGTLLILQLYTYKQEALLANFKTAYHKGSDSIRLLANRNTKNQLIFPASFRVGQERLAVFVQQHKNFKLDRLGNPKVFKYDKPELQDPEAYEKSTYRDHELTMFHDQGAIDMKLRRCSKLESKALVSIDHAVSVDTSLSEALANLLRDIDNNANPYYVEMAPFFAEDLRLQLKHDVVEHYWYRLAGSSVWLEQYQVHYMVSRVLYSPGGSRNQPAISMMFAQIYDKNWKELVNTKLVVPTNNLNVVKSEKPPPEGKKIKGEDEVHYKVLEFPYFLPIPFWHDYDNLSGKYYGPEDPRLLLVKNKAGHDEPLMVFNSYHRKLTHFDDDSDNMILMKPAFYRSMFVAWPWQYQKGKKNTDGVDNKEYNHQFYNRVVELKLENQDRMETQKNWTPFVSERDRQVEKFDRSVYFVYRWTNLEVLKCDLEENPGVCEFSYRMNPKLKTSARVGPFRGGTELINVNHLIGRDLAEQLIPTNREVWVGFARAHIDNCGCGSNMYRPNIVVVTKDELSTTEIVKTKKGEEKKTVTKAVYKVAQVSSFVSLEIPIIGWDLMNPQVICDGPNVLIPNGISDWVIKDSSTSHFIDYLTLTLSISDFTVHRINIKGLLNGILNLSNGAVFNEVVNDKSRLGFSNDNIVCALERSTEFCHEYGKEYSQASPDELKKHKLFATQDFEEEKEYNVDQVSSFQGEQKSIKKYEHEVDRMRAEKEIEKTKKPKKKGSKQKSEPEIKVTPSKGKPVKDLDDE